MRHHLIQIVFRVLLIATVSVAVNAKDIPVMEETTIEVSYKDYTIIKFPFKITNIQSGIFSYMKKKGSSAKPLPLNNGVKKITISKSKGASAANIKGSKTNVLNIKKIGNMLTMRPVRKGEIELIVWGNKEYPMIVKIKVVDEADKNINYVQTVAKRSEVVHFESSPHEVVIEKIMRFLYNGDVNPKPRGYENVVRKEVYDVGIKDRDNITFARVRATLSKEVVGKRYVGQVWNVDVVKEFDNEMNETVDMPKDFKLTLYEEMFDSPGVYAVSLETYQISQKHGTRIMMVRETEEDEL